MIAQLKSELSVDLFLQIQNSDADLFMLSKTTLSLLSVVNRCSTLLRLSLKSEEPTISNERGQFSVVAIVITTGRAAAVEARDRGRRKQRRLPSSGELLHHVLVVRALPDRWQARARATAAAVPCFDRKPFNRPTVWTLWLYNRYQPTSTVYLVFFFSVGSCLTLTYSFMGGSYSYFTILNVIYHSFAFRPVVFLYFRITLQYWDKY